MLIPHKPIPSQDFLLSRFHYCPETGVVIYIRNIKQRKVGEQVGFISDAGYWAVKINHSRFMVHRLIWRMVTGEDPGELEVDHINNTREDNRWGNLRLAVRDSNQQNALIRKDNTSGVKGVCWHKLIGMWQARVMINTKRISLGYFHSIAEAETAIRELRKELHKEFTNHG